MVRFVSFMLSAFVILSCDKGFTPKPKPKPEREIVIQPPEGLDIYDISGNQYILNLEKGESIWSHFGVGNWKVFTKTAFKEDVQNAYKFEKGIYREQDCGKGKIKYRVYDLGNLMTCLSMQKMFGDGVKVVQGNPTVVIVTKPTKIFASFNFSGPIHFVNYSQLDLYCPFCSAVSIENRVPQDPVLQKPASNFFVTICPLFKYQETVKVNVLTPQWLGLHPLCPYKNAKFEPAHNLKSNISYMPQVEINMMQMGHTYGKEVLRWQEDGLVPSSLLLQQ